MPRLLFLFMVVIISNGCAGYSLVILHEAHREALDQVVKGAETLITNPDPLVAATGEAIYNNSLAIQGRIGQPNIDRRFSIDTAKATAQAASKKNSDIDSAKTGILSTVTGYLPGGGIGEGALAMLLMILKMYYTGKKKDSELEQASTENDAVKETHIRTVKELMERVAAGEALTAQTIKDVAAQKQATAAGLAAEIRNKVKEK